MGGQVLVELFVVFYIVVWRVHCLCVRLCRLCAVNTATPFCAEGLVSLTGTQPAVLYNGEMPLIHR